MKAKLAFAGLLLAGSMALADIPSPPRGQVSRLALGAAESLSLYSALDVQEQHEFGLRTTVGKYKVWRAANGLAQLVCTARYDLGSDVPTSAECTLEKSEDGKQVPRYRPRRILG